MRIANIKLIYRSYTEHMAEDQQKSGVTALMWANIVLIVTVVFGAGVSFQRLGSLEKRMDIVEVRISQLDVIAAVQAKVQALEEEVKRARDRVDRAVDMRK